jgi:hypothetical protein
MWMNDYIYGKWAEGKYNIVIDLHGNRIQPWPAASSTAPRS